jgi:hypothetical protein
MKPADVFLAVPVGCGIAVMLLSKRSQAVPKIA